MMTYVTSSAKRMAKWHSVAKIKRNHGEYESACVSENHRDGAQTPQHA